MSEEANFVTHLECSLTGKKYEKNKIHGLSDEGKPLLVRYDLKKMGETISRDDIGNNCEPGFWRYSFMLPVEKKKNRISLGEVITPLIKLNEAVKSFNFNSPVYIKDEGLLPTSSFKARGLAMAVSMAKQLNLKHLAIPTNGNAGAALAAYATKAGIKSTVFCPDDTPEINIKEIERLGANTYKVNGLINECGKIVLEGKEKAGWFDVSTLKEPYRIEGKKTMGLELAEQLNWKLPDVIFYPTGGGTGLIGMWKAFKELQSLGVVKDPLPRMVAAQSTGCAPVVKAFQDLSKTTDFFENSYTMALGLNVPGPLGGHWILDILYDSNGIALDVPEKNLRKLTDEFNQLTLINSGPEAGVVWGAYKTLKDIGWILRDESVVLFATGIERCKL